MKKYTQDHEWVEIEGDIATVGITEHAAEELGDLTFVELPEKGLDVIVGDKLAMVESVKAASDVYAPISGTVKESNRELEDAPGLINSAAEQEGWICKIENFDVVEIEDLMTANQYTEFLAKGK
ncbi:MAG: glycine cleavage system protein GcvH [Victivallales bacterium]|nr:glycine cleavage system protein GcvH [Victivallales bacterium]